MANEKQHAEAVRELARKLKELPPLSGDYELAIAEALAQFLDQTREFHDLVADHILGNEEPKLICSACSNACTEVNRELTRWEPK